MDKKNMDKIIMDKLQFYGYHGVLAAETELGQKFFVDVELGCELEQAGKTDNLEHTVSYALIYQEIKQVMEEERYKLIEACAQRIAERILQYEGINWCLVRVSKPEAPVPGIFDRVAVEIVRAKHG